MPKKILIIDDEPDICDSISELLRDHNYEVLTSNRGTEGQELILKEKPDLVILDISLPDLDGTVIYENLRKNPETKKLKVIFLTALATGAPEQYAGIDRADYTIISKPVRFEALLKEIERVLEFVV